jgi:F-type H+-transporting ATPase subunit epsilon
MPDTIELEVATPERQLVHEHVAEVTVPAKNGYIGILPGHAPLLAELNTGVMHYTAGGRRWYMAVHGGFLEVLPDHVRVLATAAEKTDEIDVERARRALERAQAQAINPALGVDPAGALEAIHRAEARLEAASRR